METKYIPKLQSNRDLRIRFDHDTDVIDINNKEIEIDKEMVNLIKELNRLGLKTMWCCQGDTKRRKNGIMERAYISIDNSNINLEFEKDKIILRWKRGQNE